MSCDDPQALGPYRLEQLLGEGGMGKVYRAWDTRLERWVAAKRVRPEIAGLNGRRERFHREAKLAARLQHSAIVPIFDLVEEQGADWIIMEWIDGPSLADLLQDQGRFDSATALSYGLQIAEGLAAAHGEDVLHRDLKAENVMRARDGRVKILDFGLARSLADDSLADDSLVDDSLADDDSSLSSTGLILGTTYSMSPEQALGHPLDPRSDLFSLGVLLYEMLTGRSPFLGLTWIESLSRLADERQSPVYRLNPRVPKALSDLVDHLLEKSPLDRPASSAEVAGRLRALAAPVFSAPESDDWREAASIPAWRRHADSSILESSVLDSSFGPQ